MPAAHQAWEYQVIRLNIEPPVAEVPAQQPSSQADTSEPQPGKGKAKGKGSDGPSSPAAGSAMFSEAYLKEEFPRFYDNSHPDQQRAAEQSRQADPAFQLQDFLNSQGKEGWELVGIQHAKPHVFIVFKRPSGGADAAQAAINAQQEQLRLTLDLANRALAIIEKRAE